MLKFCCWHAIDWCKNSSSMPFLGNNTNRWFRFTASWEFSEVYLKYVVWAQFPWCTFNLLTVRIKRDGEAEAVCVIISNDKEALYIFKVPEIVICNWSTPIASPAAEQDCFSGWGKHVKPTSKDYDIVTEKENRVCFLICYMVMT